MRVIFFILTIAAAVFAFGGIVKATTVFTILFFIFLVLFLISLVGGRNIPEDRGGGITSRR